MGKPCPTNEQSHLPIPGRGSAPHLFQKMPDPICESANGGTRGKQACTVNS